MKEIKDDINRWRDIPFLGRKSQYCENDYTTKHNLQIQYDPYKITNGTFHRTKTIFTRSQIRSLLVMSNAKSCPTLSTPWIVACQVPLSMGFSRQEYWSGLPFPL